MDIYDSWNDDEIATLLIREATSLTKQSFLNQQEHYHMLIAHIMEKRNVSQPDMYRALLIWNQNYDRKVRKILQLDSFFGYQLKNYYRFGGTLDIIPFLHIRKEEQQRLINLEQEGRLEYVVGFVFQGKESNQIPTGVECPCIYQPTYEISPMESDVQYLLLPKI